MSLLVLPFCYLPILLHLIHQWIERLVQSYVFTYWCSRLYFYTHYVMHYIYFCSHWHLYPDSMGFIITHLTTIPFLMHFISHFVYFFFILLMFFHMIISKCILMNSI